jgi:peptidyl-prolyl isomerase F (cyclophilin D)
VVEGFEVVKAVEACGSRSGETAYDVMIQDCGELGGSSGAGVGSSAGKGAAAAVASAGRVAGGMSATLQPGARGYMTAGLQQHRRQVSQPLRMPRAAPTRLRAVAAAASGVQRVVTAAAAGRCTTSRLLRMA